MLGRMGTVCLTRKEPQPSPVASRCAFLPAVGQGSGRSAAFVGKTALPACVSFAALSKGSCFCLCGTFHVVYVCVRWRHAVWAPLNSGSGRCSGSRVSAAPLVQSARCAGEPHEPLLPAPEQRARSGVDTAATRTLLPRRQRHSLLLCGLTEQHQSLFVAPCALSAPPAASRRALLGCGSARSWTG